MKTTDNEILEVLQQLRSTYPEWRLGQLVCNVATWARGPDKATVWDVEDAEFIHTAREHLKHCKQAT